MALACLASLAIIADGLVALGWYKGRGPSDRKRVRKVAEVELEGAC